MKRRMKTIALVAPMVALALMTPAKAIPLSDLFAGDEIIVQDKRFHNWVPIENNVVGDESGRDMVNPADIEVTAWPDDPWNPGLVFTANNGALTIVDDQDPLNPNAQLNFDFSFDVEVLNPSKRWVDNELEIPETGFVEGEPDQGPPDNRSAHIHEFLFPVGGGPTFADKDVHITLDDTAGDEIILFDSANFAGRLDGTVRKDITLEAHLPGETIGILEFQQHFSQKAVPEPVTATLSLMSLGMLGAAMRRRMA